MSAALRTPRVAVIGGGIIGLSIAWRLSRGGAHVELYERGAVAREASRVAAGMLAPVSESDPAEASLLQLGLESVRRWPGFAADLEHDAGLEDGSLILTDGTLLVARDADEARWLEREARLRRRQELECSLLTPTEARLLEPDLTPRLRGALHVPGDHAVDPRAVCRALVAAAESAGAVLHEGTEIAGLADPRFASMDRVIVCAGAWPVGDGSQHGPTAVHPVKGQLLVLRDGEHHLREAPIIEHVIRGQTVYLVPRGDGRYIAGATMEHRGYDHTVTAWAVHHLLRELFEVVPATREFILEETLAGLRPATTSGDPLIGPSPNDSAGPAARTLYAIGHYRNGVLLAPATADRIEAFVLGG